MSGNKISSTAEDVNNIIAFSRYLAYLASEWNSGFHHFIGVISDYMDDFLVFIQDRVQSKINLDNPTNLLNILASWVLLVNPRIGSGATIKLGQNKLSMA